MFGLLALVVASLFTGAAFYINFAEQPARLGLDDAALLAEWKPAYKRGLTMQASLAVFGACLGTLEWLVSGNAIWFVGALLILANWPYTLLAIMPVNKKLEETPVAAAGPETRALIKDWGRRHAIRTLLGASSMLVFLWAAL